MRLTPALLALPLALLLTPVAAAQDALEIGGVRFGPAVRLEGVYWTNWENSIFEDCRDAAATACAQDAWVMCAPAACEDLEARIKALNGGSERSGRFRAVFEGRRSVEKTPKRFLHDREDKIYLERIDRFELIPSAP